MIDIVLADDHAIVRLGFKMIIEQQMDMHVVGEASDPEEALALVRQHKPHVLLTDISMGSEKSGLLLAEHIANGAFNTAVVVLTMHEEQEYLRQALQRNVRGYVLKSASDDELIKAIRQAAQGETYICGGMLGAFVRDSLEGDDPLARTLTPRESEIVSLAVRGHSNQDIAQVLSISVKTVESQKAKIMAKLGLSTKPELFEYAVAHGLVKL
ncbi:response regulator transcription factor [Arabiibacter massiliensis]|uniref:response regulator transcription factor n=1 Tax=Arabiibacter massiliensis TaxID=1870985 RepID=UPI0009BA999C|nr:response regulator transcription factor [Arabiibacter massiliensis]